ncbi:MAG TPA: septum formation initiator, partial [Treponema sp.]|nr:septum formation initiator [Treponema sp.]
MKALKYLAALWAAVAVYSVLSLFFGAMGFSAYQQLLAGRDTQLANKEELRAINATLESAQNNLRFDPDTVMVYARSLGYSRGDERFVRIVGLGGAQNPYATAGEVARTPPPVFVSDKIIKLCAL